MATDRVAVNRPIKSGQPNPVENPSHDALIDALPDSNAPQLGFDQITGNQQVHGPAPISINHLHSWRLEATTHHDRSRIHQLIRLRRVFPGHVGIRRPPCVLGSAVALGWSSCDRNGEGGAVSFPCVVRNSSNQCSEALRSEPGVHNGCVLPHAIWPPRSWDGDDVIALRQQPRKSNLSRRHTPGPCKPSQSFDLFQVCSEMLTIKSGVVRSKRTVGDSSGIKPTTQ